MFSGTTRRSSQPGAAGSAPPASRGGEQRRLRGQRRQLRVRAAGL